jgi:hypothetical protein
MKAIEPAAPRHRKVARLQKALPGLVRCAQHVHAEDFLRILAGLLRRRKAAECSAVRFQRSGEDR